MLSRNQRSKGFKVKHFLQISVLVALFFWLFKHSYDTTKPYLSQGKISENPQILEEIARRLGRKHLNPRLHDKASSGGSDKLELEEVEIIKAEDTEDDIVHEREERSADQEEEESEEVEDLIDVDDRDKDVENEELDKLGESKSQDAIGEHKLMEMDTDKQRYF